MKDFIRRLFGFTSYEIHHKNWRRGFNSALEATGRYVALERSHNIGTAVNAVIFSYDRAPQLEALLNSMLFQFDRLPTTYILYRAGNSDHAEAYDKLKFECQKKGDLKFICESDFKTELINLLEKIQTERVFFLVDDIIFTNPVQMNHLEEINLNKNVFSLRLGKNIDYSYMCRRRQSRPEITELNDNLIEWEWSAGNSRESVDWCYPLSVDGHLFYAAEILELSRTLDFKAPNSFESKLQIYTPYFKIRKGCAYTQSRCVNIPLNRVQNEEQNTHRNLHPDEILAQWQKGYKIDFRVLNGLEHNSCHVEIDLIFKRTMP